MPPATQPESLLENNPRPITTHPICRPNSPSVCGEAASSN
jgi:hypothetical protein